MMEFVDFEAINKDLRSDNDDIADTENDDGDNVSENFFDDENIFDESVENYYWFDNVLRSAEEALNDTLLFDYESREADNYCHEDFHITNQKIDRFQDSKKEILDLKKTLIAPYELLSNDCFYYSICFAIQYIISNKKSECDNEKLRHKISNAELNI